MSVLVIRKPREGASLCLFALLMLLPSPGVFGLCWLLAGVVG